jgi:hypothetical protein
MYSLLLGKNRNESGHTVSYGSINSILHQLGLRKGHLGDVVVLILDNDIILSFNFNSGGRCYCGVRGNALAVQDRDYINVVGAHF